MIKLSTVLAAGCCMSLMAGVRPAPVEVQPPAGLVRPEPVEVQPPAGLVRPEPACPRRVLPEPAARSLDERLQATADAAVQALTLDPDEIGLQATGDHRIRAGKGEDLLVERTFVYRRLIRGIPAYGAGTSVWVVVGADGGLRSTRVDWPTSLVELASAESLAHLDPERLLAAALKPAADPGLRLQAVGIRYFVKPGPGGVHEAAPVLLVLAERTGGDGEPCREHLFLPVLPGLAEFHER